MSVRLIELLQRGGRPYARRPQRRDGGLDGAVLGHLRLEDGRCRRGRLGADPGGAPLEAESGRRGGAACRIRGDGGDHSALHQPDHPGFRREPVDRRPVRRRPLAGGADGAGPDRGLHHLRQAAGGYRGRCAADAGVGPVERRDRLVRPDLHDLLRLQERLCDGDGDLRVCRGLCARRRQRRVPRAHL